MNATLRWRTTAKNNVVVYEQKNKSRNRLRSAKPTYVVHRLRNGMLSKTYLQAFFDDPLQVFNPLTQADIRSRASAFQQHLGGGLGRETFRGTFETAFRCPWSSPSHCLRFVFRATSKAFLLMNEDTPPVGTQIDPKALTTSSCLPNFPTSRIGKSLCLLHSLRLRRKGGGQSSTAPGGGSHGAAATHQDRRFVCLFTSKTFVGEKKMKARAR